MPSLHSVLILVVIFLVTSAQPAAAYIDPGNTSMAVQFVVGGVAAGLVLGRRLWRGTADRFTRLFRRTSPAPSDPVPHRRSDP
jgi:hypothetical protein